MKIEKIKTGKLENCSVCNSPIVVKEKIDVDIGFYVKIWDKYQIAGEIAPHKITVKRDKYFLKKCLFLQCGHYVPLYYHRDFWINSHNCFTSESSDSLRTESGNSLEGWAYLTPNSEGDYKYPWGEQQLILIR